MRSHDFWLVCGRNPLGNSLKPLVDMVFTGEATHSRGVLGAKWEFRPSTVLM